MLFRWDAPLFFANAEQFQEQVLTEINESPTPVRWFVVAAEPVTSVDVTAADMLVELDDELTPGRHPAYFRRDERPGERQAQTLRALSTRFDDRRFFPTLGQAVSTYVDRAGLPGRIGKTEDGSIGHRGGNRNGRRTRHPVTSLPNFPQTALDRWVEPGGSPPPRSWWPQPVERTGIQGLAEYVGVSEVEMLALVARPRRSCGWFRHRT